MKYAYYPGCVAEDTCKELDLTMGLIAGKLGIELIKLEEATCCGAGYVEDYNKSLSLFLNGRTLAMAEKLGVKTIITVCSICQLNLTKANHDLKTNEKKMRETNKYLSKIDMKYSGGVSVKPFLQVLKEDYGFDRLSSQIKKSLNLNVAAFYGCQQLRPPELHNFDDPEDPKTIDELTTALGGKPVEYTGKTKCCGFLLLMVEEGIPLKMSENHLSEAKSKGADCLVTPCPCCHIVLDMYQPKIDDMSGKKLSMPVLHLPQLIGLALGIDPKEMRLNKHVVDASGLVAKLGAPKPVQEAKGGEKPNVD